MLFFVEGCGGIAVFIIYYYLMILCYYLGDEENNSVVGMYVNKLSIKN